MISLNKEFTQVNLPPESRALAQQAALWVTCSPCEWIWTKREQELMARYVLWASQRLSAIGQLTDGVPLTHSHE